MKGCIHPRKHSLDELGRVWRCDDCGKQFRMVRAGGAIGWVEEK